KTVFNSLQELIKDGKILAGHDVASGGLITTLLEMCFADNDLSAELDLTPIGETDIIKLLFAENCGLVIQARDGSVAERLEASGIDCIRIGKPSSTNILGIKNHGVEIGLNIASLPDTWMRTSFLLDGKQTAKGLAKDRCENYKQQPLVYDFPRDFTRKMPVLPKSNRPKGDILREKGSNSEREMANAMYVAGFDVNDLHMTGLIS